MSTGVITMKETDALSGADVEMKLAEVRHVLVVDQKSNLVGVVSDRDVLRSLGKVSGKPLVVGSVMTRHVRTVRPSTPAHEAAAMMLEHKIGCLPVLDDDEHLVGIITETDFLFVAQQALAGHDVARSAAER
jgi:CBS domain-containing protein